MKSAFDLPSDRTALAKAAEKAINTYLAKRTEKNELALIEAVLRLKLDLEGMSPVPDLAMRYWPETLVYVGPHIIAVYPEQKFRYSGVKIGAKQRRQIMHLAEFDDEDREEWEDEAIQLDSLLGCQNFGIAASEPSFEPKPKTRRKPKRK